MFAQLSVFALLAIQACTVSAFPAYQSLAGLSRDELDSIVPTLRFTPPPPPPGPLANDSSKLVHDAAHPYEPLKDGDQRGPCPALNTLASHGVRNKLLSLHDPHLTDVLKISTSLVTASLPQFNLSMLSKKVRRFLSLGVLGIKIPLGRLQPRELLCSISRLFDIPR